MGDADTRRLVRHGILAGSGFWALGQTQGSYQCASLGFLLYGLNGVFGAISQFVDEDIVKKAYEFTGYLCDNLCLPLIACDSCMSGGIPKEYAFINLAIPGFEVVMKMLTNKDTDFQPLVRTSHAVSIGMIAYVSFNKGNDAFGYILALLYFLAEFSTQDMDDDVRALIVALASPCAFFHLSGKTP